MGSSQLMLTSTNFGSQISPPTSGKFSKIFFVISLLTEHKQMVKHLLLVSINFGNFINVYNKHKVINNYQTCFGY